MGYVKWRFTWDLLILQQQIKSASLQSTTPGLNCPPNSHFGFVSDCDISCSNVDIGSQCSGNRTLGCKCDKGFYAQTSTSGKSVDCVKPEYCNTSCGPKKYYDPEANGCQPTCEWPDLPLYCKAPQRPLCVCMAGYMFSQELDYECVEESGC
ncbi:hypothetical protein PRIEUP_LOCUS460, partial [Pristimantis euphronides]